MKKLWNHLIMPIIGLVIGFVFYLFYIHAISLLNPVLNVILGGGFILALIFIFVNFIRNMKDFVVSIFKENKETDEKGFKKHF